VTGTDSLTVDLEFPGGFAGEERLGQAEAGHNGSNSKQPCKHRHGEPSTYFREP
jgi:hypothetical protein